MNTANKLLIGLGIFAITTLVAQEFPINIKTDGKVFLVATTNDTTTFVATNNDLHSYVIHKLTIEAQASASPVDYIISGEIIDSATGVPAKVAPLPVFLGSSSRPPILSAITDAYGKFCFRIWLKENRPSQPMQVGSITNADIYIGRANIYWASAYGRQQFDSDMTLKSGLVRKYSLAELLTDAQKIRLSH